MQQASVIIVGGGVIGLATAYRLLQSYPSKSVLVLEKEDKLAAHQSGHNSGVLHTGIYYRPGSLKAMNCRQGRDAMVAFCREQGIDHEICGKVIVAVDDGQLSSLQQLYDRGQANGVRCEFISAEQLRDLEPHAAGVRAIHVPDAGIVDYRQVCQRLSDLITASNARVITGARVVGMTEQKNSVVIETTRGQFQADCVVNCAGLHSDRVTRMSGVRPAAKIIPFRGEYFQLRGAGRGLIRNLIYPVPDPSFPFLGVHFTRMIDGSVECGPNAVLAWAREGYKKSDVNLRDLAESLTYPGFIRLALKYWRIGAGEMWRSLSKRAFVRALQRLVPEIEIDHLEPALSGVRAQAVGRDGSMIDDFLFQESPRAVNVGNAPSPAATASLNIGQMIVEKLATRFD